MKPVFVDASYWIALRADNQVNHSRARELAVRMARERRRLVTTHLVFAEIHAFFSRHQTLGLQVLNDFFVGNICAIEAVDPADFSSAAALLRKSEDKSYSYCDAVSFVLMRRLGLQQALSFDNHFQQIGEFEIL